MTGTAQPAAATTDATDAKPAAPAPGQDTSTQSEDAKQITMSPAQLAGRLDRAKPSDYEELKAKAARFDELENRNKTDLQRLTDERDQFKTRGESAEQQAARFEVALAKGLTATQAKRLVGSTKEEFEADADELLKDLGALNKTSVKPNSAQRNAEEVTSSGDWLRDQFANRT